MKVKYDKETDILYITFVEKPINESDEDKPGIILDYGADGEIVGIEILDASHKMPTPEMVEVDVVG